jgi:hypothetical protein
VLEEDAIFTLEVQERGMFSLSVEGLRSSDSVVHLPELNVVTAIVIALCDIPENYK